MKTLLHLLVKRKAEAARKSSSRSDTVNRGGVRIFCFKYYKRCKKEEKNIYIYIRQVVSEVFSEKFFSSLQTSCFRSFISEKLIRISYFKNMVSERSYQIFCF